MDTISLNNPWFDLVREGKKTYEGRRRTPQTKALKIGQTLTVKHYTDERDTFQVVVEGLLYFDTFEEALLDLDINKVLPVPGITVAKGVDVYKQYVSLDTQNKDGVVMIKIRVQKPDEYIMDKISLYCTLKRAMERCNPTTEEGASTKQDV